MKLEPAWRPQRIEALKLKHWRTSHSWVETVDELTMLLEELFRAKRFDISKGSAGYEQAVAQFNHDYKAGRDLNELGEWWYYPWLARLVRLLPCDEHRLVRASRNRNLITADEQKMLQKAKIGIPGLSVGSQALQGLILTAGFAEIRVADFDTVELSNLQRLGDGNGVADLGLPKWVQAARMVAELDPWTGVVPYRNGLQEDNINQFVEGLDATLCAIDDLPLKLRLRQTAKANRVPVVMVTDTENTFLDVEPYHQLDWEPFHGLLSADELAALQEASPEDKQTFIRLAMKIIGLSHHTAELLASLPLIGTELVSQPQLGTSAMLAGAVAARTIVRLLLGKEVPYGRTVIGVEALLDPSYDKPLAVQQRAAIAQRLGAPPLPNPNLKKP